MIVTTDELSHHRGRVAMVDGGFDPLHAGHIEYFTEAAKLGAPVLCNVSSDDYVARKHPPLLSQAQRGRLIDALRPVDFTHLSRSSTEAVLRELRPRYYVKGSDWRDRLPPEQVEICREGGTEIVYLDTVLHSSSELLRALLDQKGPDAMTTDTTQAVEEFEQAVLAQDPVAPAYYDDEYFTAGWREHGNRYDLETRRRVEAEGPARLVEVFAPRRVLDVGCGPGFLMYFLQELGVEADGVDFSPQSPALAPPEVSDRIVVAPVTEPQVPDGAYDLIVCREVLEHLTVLQVRQTVAAMCRATSRFVYITTRFHPAPEGLLSFTTEFDVDPSHITLLNKDLLRCLLVLEGMHRRPDLEDAMDWAGKNRVLVYEKPAAG